MDKILPVVDDSGSDSAILDNTIAFTLCEDRNPKIELYGDKNKSAEVVIDYISQVLQDNGYENASKYIDAMFEL